MIVCDFAFLNFVGIFFHSCHMVAKSLHFKSDINSASFLSESAIIDVEDLKDARNQLTKKMFSHISGWKIRTLSNEIHENIFKQH